MRFIKLTNKNYDPSKSIEEVTEVQAEFITRISVYQNITQVYLSDGSPGLDVTESPEKIKELITQAEVL